jgi:hypothetical protein
MATPVTTTLRFTANLLPVKIRKAKKPVREIPGKAFWLLE